MYPTEADREQECVKALGAPVPLASLEVRCHPLFRVTPVRTDLLDMWAALTSGRLSRL